MDYVDRSQKQPVTCCDKGIKQFRDFTSEKRLFKFLTGLNLEYNAIRRDILKLEPYPSVEEAYALVKKEATRCKIMSLASSSPIGDATGVGSTDTSSGEIGYGFGAQRDRPNRNGPQRPPPAGAAAHQAGGKPDKRKLWCSHCGKNKHTKESCFLQVGYPEWWDKRQRARAQAKFAGVGITEQQNQSSVPSRVGGTGGGNLPHNPPNQEAGTESGGGGVGSVRVGNFVEKAGETKSHRWGGGDGYLGGKGFDKL